MRTDSGISLKSVNLVLAALRIVIKIKIKICSWMRSSLVRMRSSLDG